MKTFTIANMRLFKFLLQKGFKPINDDESLMCFESSDELVAAVIEYDKIMKAGYYCERK